MFKLTPIEPEMSAGAMPTEVLQQLYQAKPMPYIDPANLKRMVAKACFGIDNLDEVEEWRKEKRKSDEHLDD